MTPFAYHRARSVEDAVRVGETPGAHFLGGGTNLVDLAKGGFTLNKENAHDRKNCAP